MNKFDVVDKVFLITAAIVAAILIFAVSQIIAGENAKAGCLEKGYPKSFTTYKFDTYCATIDGAVSVKVEKQ